jgi:hypothetical protein
MARDYRVVRRTARGEIIFDEGHYTFVPGNFTPYKYKRYKKLNSLLKKERII